MNLNQTTPSHQILIFFTLILVIFNSGCKKSIPLSYPEKSIAVSDEKAKNWAENILNGVSPTVDSNLTLDLWASDTLVQDPIAISIDDHGRVFYTSAIRQNNSEFDIRQHKNWMTASISFQTIEDRRDFLRKTFEADSEESLKFLKDLNGDGVRDWKDLTVEKEQIWFVEDQSKDGYADYSQLYLEDFHEEITDVANGIEVSNGEVFICVGPDMWRTKDVDGDWIADEVESISRGYAVHIGFGGHGMSGAIIGPAGRIWWGIGDIGANVIDQTGKRHEYPNEGVIVRADRDGSHFEVFAHGLRNTHEFVFDEMGNLITEDNDGDQKGERERLTYLIDGSDSGWRINWQFGKYTDPLNNTYRVWTDEKMHLPRWDGQAAYFLPPITNYVNGPTGLVYNPGTALSPQWYQHFFIAEFRGTPARSPIHAFTLAPDGAGFKLDQTKEVVNGLLPTGLDFGPDGALYFGDWVDGWDPKKKGRIWKLDDETHRNSAIRKETQMLLATDFSKETNQQLAKYLAHQDLRVRKKAQFALVALEEKGFDIFNATLNQDNPQLAKIHAIWGIAQLARTFDPDYAAVLIPFLRNSDEEICAQAAKYLGDVKYSQAENPLIRSLYHPNPRVQLFAIEALGRIKSSKAITPILEVVRENNGQDLWIRQAAAIALARIQEVDPLVNLYKSHHVEEKIVAVIALRRMQAPEIELFLDDENEYIVAEVARAINDDLSIPAALPALANLMNKKPYTSEPLIRRVINANLRVGKPENLDALLTYISNSNAPADMRAEALAAVSTWAQPSVLDRVDGRYRGKVERSKDLVVEKTRPLIARLLNDRNTEIKEQAIKTIGTLQISNYDDQLLNLSSQTREPSLKTAILSTLNQLKSDQLPAALDRLLSDQNAEVRAYALEILPQSPIDPSTSIPLFEKVLNHGSIEEQQAVYAALTTLSKSETEDILTRSLQKLIDGEIPPETSLDLIEAAEKNTTDAVAALLELYEQSKDQNNIVEQYKEALYGGNRREGYRIFYNHESAQCIRCHAVFEVGGNAGPGLAEVGNRLSREKLLESLLDPSAAYAPGYALVSITMKNGDSFAGTLQSENDAIIVLQSGNGDQIPIKKDEIATQNYIPSSMPNMTSILTRREMRDLVAFLASLTEAH